ncbi:nucleoside phosphorylase [Streptococcus sp. C150]|uniref:nucleoside phosphorylase n=2 Tax=unclassified Streptococcus TaxID=2608887 RepID=UPI0001F890F8|nr:nucleoside phosphorylase [Streptococcus sp. C150]EFX55113.1 phosphorylase family [Streptococcus sp. C150]
MIHKHEIPILEFDDNPQAVIMPTHEDLDLNLPSRCVYAFLGEEIERYANAIGAEKVGEFVSATKTYPVYVMTYNGEEICLAQAPVGSAAAAQFLDWLIGYGVKQILSTGTCGVLVDMPENVFLIPTRALRDEGASYHYVAPSRYIEVNRRALTAIETVLRQASIPYQEVMTWSTDGFYRETPDKVAYRIEEGCSVVEMECAALAAVAQLRDAVWGLLLFTADSLADLENYDQRDWGSEAFGEALVLCLDIIVQM